MKLRVVVESASLTLAYTSGTSAWPALSTSISVRKVRVLESSASAVRAIVPVNGWVRRLGTVAAQGHGDRRADAQRCSRSFRAHR